MKLRTHTSLTIFTTLFVPMNVAAHQVIAIADGDTLTILVDQKPLKIRLANIDAPEKNQPFGQKSKESLSELCAGKKAKYQPLSVDKYRRIIANVKCNSVDVNVTQVKRGLAWVYSKYNVDPHLPNLQISAQQQAVGLWGIHDPIPPWQWRAEKRR